MSHVAVWQCRDRSLDLATPVVMGVLNVTPDSFSDGGRFARRDAALAHARRMIDEGAGIVDIGGESTRPGASPATLDEELARVIPVIEALRARVAGFHLHRHQQGRGHARRRSTPARTSSTTCARCRSPVRSLPPRPPARASVSCTCAASRAPCRMRRVTTTWSRKSPDFSRPAFAPAVKPASSPPGSRSIRGSASARHTAHNLALLKHLGRFEPLGAAIAVGLSRKSMLAKLTGRAVDDRIAGSVALAAIAVLNGARIVRAHDVAATLDAVRVAAAVTQGRSNSMAS